MGERGSWTALSPNRDPEGGTVTTQGIRLLYLETHDWERSVVFWQELGFKVEFETDHRSGVLVAENGTRVFLAEQSLDDPLGADIYLAVDNSVACVPEALPEVVREFTPTHWGTQVMTVRDPDGRLLRLEAPVASESE
jgi:catechol 2,3-dioxygenase-like lactoylglutathione lyase family enzyme